MAQIASASGIAVAQIYRDFRNKNAIIAAICETDLASWLRENELTAAIKSGHRVDVEAWLERVSTHDIPPEDRRLMCELLAEAGRNPVIAEVNRTATARVRHNMDQALRTLVPSSTCEQRGSVIDFLLLLSWGNMARMDDPAFKQTEASRTHVRRVIDLELLNIGGEKEGGKTEIAKQSESTYAI